jgi:RNA polymerase sigma-70 factor (ECF subfamily)
MDDREPQGPLLELERFRGYLSLLTRQGLGPEFRGKVDPSDVVQQTLLEAHQSQGLFRGRTSAQQAAWLRQILVKNLADLARGFQRKKRDLAREVSLETVLENSSVRLEGLLRAQQPSPSEHAARQEEVLRVADALASLPEPEQEALLLRHCQDMTIVEVGQRMGVSRYAVARLIHHGVLTLREKLKGRD